MVDPNIIRAAASSLGAVPADIPGLWNVPGHPELTTGQLLDLFGRMARNVPLGDITALMGDEG